MVVSIVLFIVSILLFWADWFIIQYSWANMYDGMFRISENALIPILVLMLITGICSFASVVKRVKSKGGSPVLKSSILIIALIVIVGTCATFTHSLTSTGYQVTAVVNVESKEADDSSHYYLLIKGVDTDNPVKIKCDKETYNKIQVDENILYTIEYRLNLFDSKSGNLYNIDLNDYVDNRKIN
ncbi:MAG: hypothetical protein PWQ93_1119 [Clostridiales bacterium]|nr:hypothetical protein [Clostridiales bacterium]